MVQPASNRNEQGQTPDIAAKARVKAEYRYPVYDLRDSVTVAQIIREQGGGAASADRLASYLKYGSTNNGAFLARIAAARLFGLIERDGSNYVPTRRALKIIAPERPGVDEKAALVEAFKEVPLYRVLFDRYRGQALPPEVGLRNAMQTQYGIPKERTATAYRVLMDSAHEAGYFEARGGQRTHLVEPGPGGVSSPAPVEDDYEEPQQPDGTLRIPASPAIKEQPRARVSALEKLQEALVDKVKEIPAEDLEKIREYIKEIERIDQMVEKSRESATG